MRGRWICALVALLVMLLPGCANDGEDDGPNAAPNQPVTLEGKTEDHGTEDVTESGAEASVDMEADDFYFSPTFVKASPSAGVTVELQNAGDAPHTFTIESLQIDETLQPGDKKSIKVALPASGAVRFTCTFHAGSGMQGAFFFNEGDTVATGE